MRIVFSEKPIGKNLSLCGRYSNADSYLKDEDPSTEARFYASYNLSVAFSALSALNVLSSSNVKLIWILSFVPRSHRNIPMRDMPNRE